MIRKLHSHLLMVKCLREWRNERKRMTPTGKIARLPAAFREELNQRLLDGEQSPELTRPPKLRDAPVQASTSQYK